MKSNMHDDIGGNFVKKKKIVKLYSIYDLINSLTLFLFKMKLKVSR